MAIERPTIEQLQALASRLNIRLTPAQAEEYLALMQANFDAYDLIDALPDEIPAVHYPRAAGYRPEGDENPLNAWYYKTEVTGAATGKLAGRTVVLKDNIALAGVPMMNGASTLEGFVPSTTPPLPPDCWMPARLFSAKPPASTSACREAAIPPIRRPCITRCAAATRPVAHLLAAPLWSLPGSRFGHGWRSRGLGAYSRRMVWPLWPETDPRSGALYRHHADRSHFRPYRTDDPQRKRQCLSP